MASKTIVKKGARKPAQQKAGRPALRTWRTAGAAIAIAAATAGAALVSSAQREVLRSRAPVGATAAPAAAAPGAAARSKTANAVAATGRKPVAYYTQAVAGSLFAEPQPPAPPKPPAPRIPVAVHRIAQVVLPPDINPYSEWAYTGMVTMGDRTMALIENTKTAEGQYVSIGDSFMGGSVSGISHGLVTLRSSGKTYSLAMATEQTLVPLDKSAAYLTAQPAQAPGANGQAMDAMQAALGGQPGQAGQPGQSGMRGNRRGGRGGRRGGGPGGGGPGGGGPGGGGFGGGSLPGMDPMSMFGGGY